MSTYGEVHGTVDDALRGYMRPVGEVKSANVTRRTSSDTVLTHGNAGRASLDAGSRDERLASRDSRPTLGGVDEAERTRLG